MEDNYENLRSKGFNDKQINQIFILDKYISVDTLLAVGINPNIDTNILRNFNNHLKSHELSNDETADALYIMCHGFDPCLYLDLEGPQRMIMFKIINRKVEEDLGWFSSPSANVDLQKLHYLLQLMNIDDEIANLIIQDTFINNNPLDYLRPDFTKDQIITARCFAIAGLQDRVDDVKLLNKKVEDWLTLCLIKSYGFNLIDTINLYHQSDISTAVDIMKYGFDINTYVKEHGAVNIPFVKLMVSKKLTNNMIVDMLDNFKFVDRYDCDITNLEYMLDMKLKGYNVDKYFESTPTRAVMQAFMILQDNNVDMKDVKDFLNLFQSYFGSSLLKLKDYDVVKYYDLFQKKYNIEETLSLCIDSSYLKMLEKVCCEYHKDFQNYITNDDFYYYKDKMDCVNCCKEFDREDLIPAVLLSKNFNNNIAKDIRYLIKDGFDKNVKYDIAKFLFDKGNDVFNDYSVEYEFSAVQKRLLLEKFLKESLSSGKVNINNINAIRDNKIESKKMNELIEIIKDGFSVDKIIKDIDKIDSETISSVHKLMKLGYDISNDELEK